MPSISLRTICGFSSTAINRLVSTVESLGDHIADHRIIVAHADSPDIAEETVRMLKERLGDSLRIEVTHVNPTAGSHCGPNTVGISFHAKHR